MRRTVATELLDSDLGTPEEIEASLADLRRINRYFGGVATACSMLQRVLEHKSQLLDSPDDGRCFLLLDVGSGAGYVPLAVAHQLRTQAVKLRLVLVDRSSRHLPRSSCSSAVSVAADALALPFGDRCVDVVSCALFAHHLEPDEIVCFVNEALRVARSAVLINDLRRSWLHLAAVYAGFPLYRSRLTRHDAPASVRRAYTPDELEAILKRTRAHRIEIRNHYFFRMGAIAWKSQATT